jgi:hypothetical protein
MQALAAGEPAAPVWYALSLAADSLDERRIYLQKALEADPLYESARRDLAGLGTVATPAVQERAPAPQAPSKAAEKKSGPPAVAVLLLLIVGACAVFAMMTGGGGSLVGRVRRAANHTAVSYVMPSRMCPC